jgi:hypothetical protein
VRMESVCRRSVRLLPIWPRRFLLRLESSEVILGHWSTCFYFASVLAPKGGGLELELDLAENSDTLVLFVGRGRL